jgi:hypothetical protein
VAHLFNAELAVVILFIRPRNAVASVLQRERLLEERAQQSGLFIFVFKNCDSSLQQKSCHHHKSALFSANTPVNKAENAEQTRNGDNPDCVKNPNKLGKGFSC